MVEEVSVFAIPLGQESLALQTGINIDTCGAVHFEKQSKCEEVISSFQILDGSLGGENDFKKEEVNT